MFDTSNGDYFDISILDVMQIFGRAGRPQYDTEGFGIIITAHNKLPDYLSLFTNQYPIESSFKKYLSDNLNAEICLGTIKTIPEAIDWIRETYFWQRIRKNPEFYKTQIKEFKSEEQLYEFCEHMVLESVDELKKAQMICISPNDQTFESTDLGLIASHYYIKFDTILKFNESLKEKMIEKDIFSMIACAQEFDHMKVWLIINFQF